MPTDPSSILMSRFNSLRDYVQAAKVPADLSIEPSEDGKTGMLNWVYNDGVGLSAGSHSVEWDGDWSDIWADLIELVLRCLIDSLFRRAN